MKTLLKHALMFALLAAAFAGIIIVAGEQTEGASLSYLAFMGLKFVALAGLAGLYLLGRHAYRHGWLPDYIIREIKSATEDKA